MTSRFEHRERTPESKPSTIRQSIASRVLSIIDAADKAVDHGAERFGDAIWAALSAGTRTFFHTIIHGSDKKNVGKLDNTKKSSRPAHL